MEMSKLINFSLQIFSSVVSGISWQFSWGSSCHFCNTSSGFSLTFHWDGAFCSEQEFSICVSWYFTWWVSCCFVCAFLVGYADMIELIWIHHIITSLLHRCKTQLLLWTEVYDLYIMITDMVLYALQLSGYSNSMVCYY
jgi:hypothetical protein